MLTILISVSYTHLDVYKRQGLDSLQTLDVYMESADGTIEAKRFTGVDISHMGTVVSPSQPFRTTSGYKTIYIVVNKDVYKRHQFMICLVNLHYISTRFLTFIFSSESNTIDPYIESHRTLI